MSDIDDTVKKALMLAETAMLKSTVNEKSITDHVKSCEKRGEENSKKLDTIESLVRQGNSELHTRIDEVHTRITNNEKEFYNRKIKEKEDEINKKMKLWMWLAGGVVTILFAIIGYLLK